MDCVSVSYQTILIELVLTYILNYTVFNCFKQRQLIENKVFNPQSGCGGRKHFSFRHLYHLGDSPPLPAGEGGGGVQKRCLHFKFLWVVLPSSYFPWCQRGQFQNRSKQVSIIGITPQFQLFVRLSLSRLLWDKKKHNSWRLPDFFKRLESNSKEKLIRRSCPI